MNLLIPSFKEDFTVDYKDKNVTDVSRSFVLLNDTNDLVIRHRIPVPGRVTETMTSGTRFLPKF